MKRIIFLTRFFTPHIGGVEKHVYFLSQELVKKGYEVTVITEQFDDFLLEKEVVNGVEVLRISPREGSEKTRIWSWMFECRAILEYADVVHVHDVMWWVYPMYPLIFKKLFVTFHGWEGQFPIKKSTVIQRRLNAKLSKGVIHIGAFIEKWYGTQADITLYGGVEETNNNLRHSQRVNNNKPMIVFMGRLENENNVKEIFKTVKILREGNMNIPITFVGDGKYRKECEDVGTVTGFVINPEKYLSEASVVFTSSYLSMLEAMKAGKLVVSMYNNELKYDYLSLHPQAKNIVLGDDPGKVAQEVLAYLKDPTTYSKRIQETQKWAKQQTWKRVAEQYEQLWGKI